MEPGPGKDPNEPPEYRNFIANKKDFILITVHIIILEKKDLIIK